jgi:membrane protein DedA with SNARE-associated domain
MATWIIETIAQFGYLGIFLLMLLESIFPPIPSELIIPFAGFAAQQGDLNFFGVLIAATLGSLVGMVPWYLAGRLFGLGRVRALADRFGRWFTLNAEEIDTATGFFRRYGPLIVLFGRLLPIIRTLISVPAGLAHMPVGQFVLYSTIGAVVWNTLLTGGGFLLAEHYEVIETWLDPVTLVILGAVLVVYVWRLITWRPSSKS